MDRGASYLLSSKIFLMLPRRSYLAGDVKNLYPFIIQGSLEWPFSELFLFDISLWNQYKYIIFNNLSCTISNITGISNVKTNELTIYAILWWNVTIFWRQGVAFSFTCRKSWKHAGIQIQTSRVAVSLQVTVIWKSYGCM